MDSQLKGALVIVLLEKYMTDMNNAVVYEFLSSGKLPQLHQECKHIWCMAQKYFLDLTGHLWFRTCQGARLCVTVDQVTELLLEFHDSVEDGYFGHDGMFEWITHWYYWPHIYTIKR